MKNILSILKQNKKIIVFVELNHPSQIAISKLPDSFDNSKLCTTKISDDEKGIGFYYH
jgi:hypothetical protein